MKTKILRAAAGREVVMLFAGSVVASIRSRGSGGGGILPGGGLARSLVLFGPQVLMEVAVLGGPSGLQ